MLPRTRFYLERSTIAMSFETRLRLGWLSSLRSMHSNSLLPVYHLPLPTSREETTLQHTQNGQFMYNVTVASTGNLWTASKLPRSAIVLQSALVPSYLGGPIPAGYVIFMPWNISTARSSFIGTTINGGIGMFIKSWKNIGHNRRRHYLLSLLPLSTSSNPRAVKICLHHVALP